VTNSNIAFQKNAIQEDITEQILTNAISEESTIFRFPGYPSFSVAEGSRNLNGSGLVFNGSGPDFNGSGLIFNGSITVPLPQCLNHFDLNHGDTFVPAVKTNSRISATTTTNP
jgi:hypothetical protein